MRPVLLGEAPGRTAPDPEAFAGDGSSARRLRELLDVQDLRDAVEPRNLLPVWPGPRWPAALAREAARTALRGTSRRVVLAAGRRVSDALGLRHYTYLETAHSLRLPWCPTYFRDARALVALALHSPGPTIVPIPHPSGRNRWWNDPENAERARGFLRSLLEAGKAART